MPRGTHTAYNSSITTTDITHLHNRIGAKARTSCYERPSCFPRVLYGSLDGDNTNALRSSMGLEHDDATFKKYTVSFQNAD